MGNENVIYTAAFDFISVKLNLRSFPAINQVKLVIYV